MIAPIYRELASTLTEPLQVVRRLAEEPKLSRRQEGRLRGALRQIALVTAPGIIGHLDRSSKNFRDIQEAIASHQASFGHPPGSVIRVGKQGQHRVESSCVDVAFALTHLLSRAVNPSRISIVRLNGPAQIHPSVVLGTAHGKQYLVDNWGLEGRRKAYEWPRFQHRLVGAIGRRCGEYAALSDSLGLDLLKSPKETLTHPYAFLHGGPKLLEASAYENHALAALVADQPKEAMRFANRALKLAPESDNAAFTKGNVFFDDGRYSDSARWYRRALELNPNHSLALEQLAWIHEMRGDEKAKAEVEQRLMQVVRPHHPGWKRAYKQLEAFLDRQVF